MPLGACSSAVELLASAILWYRRPRIAWQRERTVKSTVVCLK